MKISHLLGAMFGGTNNTHSIDKKGLPKRNRLSQKGRRKRARQRASH